MKSIEEIREAFDKVHRRACGEDVCYMSVPARPEHDADLIVSAALDELAALREENAKLREAIRKRDEGGHQPFCPTWHGRECNCFPPEWNALVRGMQ